MCSAIKRRTPRSGSRRPSGTGPGAWPRTAARRTSSSVTGPEALSPRPLRGRRRAPARLFGQAEWHESSAFPTALAGGRTRVLADDDEHRPDRDDVALSDHDPRDFPRRGRGNLDRGLVGLDLDEGVVLGDLLALLHQPTGDLALGQPFAQIRQLELVRHGPEPTEAARSRRPPARSAPAGHPRRATARPPARRHRARPPSPAGRNPPGACVPRSRSRRRSGRAHSRLSEPAPGGAPGRTRDRAALRAVRHAGHGNNPNAGVLPPHRLAGRRIAQVVAGVAALQQQADPLAHPTLSASPRSP